MSDIDLGRVLLAAVFALALVGATAMRLAGVRAPPASCPGAWTGR